MSNALRVLGRDLLRLLKNPTALVVVIVLVVLPSLYSWYNVRSFWDPYNNTGNVSVSIVNEDKGTNNDLVGHLNAGDMVVEELKKNDQLHWVFEDKETALEALKRGERYAVFIIPATFSQNLLSITEGALIQPKLLYYVNEKVGPVSPKITDTGASTLDETLNATVIETVSNVALKTIQSQAGDAKQSFSDKQQSVSDDFTQALSALDSIQQTISDSQANIEITMSKINEGKGNLSDLGTSITAATQEINALSDAVSNAQYQLSTYAGEASAQAATALEDVRSAQAQTQSFGSTLLSDFDSAHAKATDALNALSAQSVNVDALITDLQTLSESLSSAGLSTTELEELIAHLDENRNSFNDLLATATTLNTSFAGNEEALSNTLDTFNTSSQTVIDTADTLSSTLFETRIPALAQDLSTLSSAINSIASATENLLTTLDAAYATLDSLTSMLEEAHTTLGELTTIVAQFETGIEETKSSFDTLGTAQTLNELFGDGSTEPGKIASFIASPTKVVTEKLYPLNAYGSAMAPLFMNLTFWIGAFMLLVIMNQEVDKEGIPKLTSREAYVGRFLLFAILVILQALICCAGILFLGVETVSAPALFIASVVCSLSYLSVIYALSVSFQHIGKGLCIILVFAQIPAATGLYPIEMTSPFFQSLYPLLPFTYGIGALREAICGFYGYTYLFNLLILVAFFVVFFIIGVTLRPYTANINHTVASGLKQAGIFNGESALLKGREFSYQELGRALAHQQAYQQQVLKRYQKLMDWRPRLLKLSIILSVIIPIILGVVFAITPAEKTVLLTIWLCWLAFLFVTLIGLENYRSHLSKCLELGGLSVDDLIKLASQQQKSSQTSDGEVSHE